MSFLKSTTFGLILIGAISGAFSKSLIGNGTSLLLNYILSFQKNNTTVWIYDDNNGMIQTKNKKNNTMTPQFSLSLLIFLLQIVFFIVLVWLIYEYLGQDNLNMSNPRHPRQEDILVT